MKVFWAIVRLLFTRRTKKIGSFKKGCVYIMFYEKHCLDRQTLDYLSRYLYENDTIKIIALPVYGDIDKVRFM